MPTTYYPYDNGTVGPTGPAGPQGPAGAAGAPGVVQSVNGKSIKDVVLAATDVNALPSNANAQLNAQYLWLNTAAGIYRALGFRTAGTDRWLVQVDDTAETGSAAGSNFRLSSRNDDGSFNKTTIYAIRSTGQIAFNTTDLHGTATVTSGGSIGLRDLTADPATFSGGVFLYSKSGVPYFKTADGTSFQVQPVSYPVTSVNGNTGAVNLGAADVGAIPSSQKGTASGVANLDSTGRLPATQMPTVAARNVWTPQALGFQAWSVDPAAVANPKNWAITTDDRGVIKAAALNRAYLSGMNITEPTSVSKVVVFARGWGGSSLLPNTRFKVAIYNESGTRVAYSGTTALSNVPAAGQEAGTPSDAKNNHVGAVPFPLSASTLLQPGRYWAAFLVTAGTATDFYYMHIENWSPSNPSNFHLLGTAFMRAGYLSSQTDLPAAITPSSMNLDHDPCIMALA